MRYLLLFVVALLKIATMKTEPINFTRKNGRMDMLLPLNQNREKDTNLNSGPKNIEANNYQHEWINDDPKFQVTDIQKQSSFDDSEEYENEDFDTLDLPQDQFKSIDQLDDVQSARFSNYLIKFLQQPDIWETPIILVKDTSDNLEDRPFSTEEGLRGIAKRSRYYRPYPWKRQNPKSYNNMDYDPYNPCNPTRVELFRLLQAVHDARQGNKSRYVNFCNRRRPASAVYTNIRFLGRRKK